MGIGICTQPHFFVVVVVITKKNCDNPNQMNKTYIETMTLTVRCSITTNNSIIYSVDFLVSSNIENVPK